MKKLACIITISISGILLSLTASVIVPGCSATNSAEMKLQRKTSLNRRWKFLKQDINLADFEGSGFGSGTTTGTAFGSGSASSAVGDQQRVTGFLGSGFANSYTGGKSATGTLLSLRACGLGLFSAAGRSHKDQKNA